MNVTLRKYGNSTVAVMPPMVLKALKLSAGQAMTLDTTDDGKIVLSKTSQPTKYTLEELLAQCDLSAPQPEELREWDNMKPVGNEVW
ncbi:MAG: ChpB-ChpS toxin-antitoxin system antitoxin [Gammaproteobacteria bacterium]|nr:ChpB-ChpS toxin-antitoxin system antitoxin [Gammaproteobacteria bacterium]